MAHLLASVPASFASGDLPASPMSNIVRQGLGPLLLGSYASLCLYTFECLFMLRAFLTTKRQYSRPMKATLAVLWFIDSVGVLAAFANLWQYGIRHWGDNNLLRRQYWPMIAYVLTSSSGGAIVQVVLASRYWALSKNVPACLVIALCWVGHIGGGILSAVWLARFPGYDQRAKLTVPVTIYLIGAVATDTLIASLLVYKLSAARRKVVSFESSNLKKPLERLIRTSVETGAATALLAVAALVSYLADKPSNISPCFGEVLGRTYTLTLLFILLQQRTIGDDVQRRPTKRRFGFPRTGPAPHSSGNAPSNSNSCEKTSSGGAPGALGRLRKARKPAPIKVTTNKHVRFISPVPTPLEMQSFEDGRRSRAALSPSLFTLGSFQSDAGGEGDAEDVAEKGGYRGEVV